MNNRRWLAIVIDRWILNHGCECTIRRFVVSNLFENYTRRSIGAFAMSTWIQDSGTHERQLNQIVGFGFLLFICCFRVCKFRLVSKIQSVRSPVIYSASCIVIINFIIICARPWWLLAIKRFFFLVIFQANWIIHRVSLRFLLRKESILIKLKISTTKFTFKCANVCARFEWISDFKSTKIQINQNW